MVPTFFPVAAGGMAGQSELARRVTKGLRTLWVASRSDDSVRLGESGGAGSGRGRRRLVKKAGTQPESAPPTRGNLTPCRTAASFLCTEVAGTYLGFCIVTLTLRSLGKVHPLQIPCLESSSETGHVRGQLKTPLQPLSTTTADTLKKKLTDTPDSHGVISAARAEIGRASCRERVS